MRRNQLLFAILPTAAALLALIHAERNFVHPKGPPGLTELPAAAAIPEPPPAPAPLRTFRDSQIEPGLTIWEALRSAGLSKDATRSLIASIKPVMDLRRLAAGTPVRAIFEGDMEGREDGEPASVELRLGDIKRLVATPMAGGAWDLTEHETPVETRLVSYAGIVTSSLWASAVTAGMDPRLIAEMTEIFAWQTDFNREVQENDRWRLTVERLYAEEKPIGFGAIIAAEYENVGVPALAVHFEHEGVSHYYTPEGNSLRRMFLKSPLKFGRITSGFQAARFHPILKVSRPHLGVDYGASAGTPVLAVGDGVVSFAANRGSSGKMITVRHNAIYQTQYKHLQSFAKSLAPGTRVVMGQVIGYVGSTGLATGPHLHFEFHEGSDVVDPQGLKFPSADPVPSAQRKLFEVASAKALATLPSWDLSIVVARGDTPLDPHAE